MGVQVLLPPHFVDSKLISLPVVGHVVGTVLSRSETRTAVAAELSEIRDRGHLIIGIKNNRPPLGFVNEAGEISGFEVDIARQLAADLLGDASAIEFVPLSNVDRLNSVLEERVDIAIAANSRNWVINSVTCPISSLLHALGAKDSDFSCKSVGCLQATLG